MNQMNNELNELNVDELYSIASHLKVAKDSMEGYEKMIEKNPSHSMRQNYVNAFNEYKKAFNDFNYFLENYIVFDTPKDNKISNLQKEKILGYITRKINEEFAKIRTGLYNNEEEN
ncbi:MAG: hypothetical protein IJH39_09300 [Clostridia bacterium]|nr:hypothetical protein [Clostridia bacterium]